MREKKGVLVPPEDFEQLEKDIADWEDKLDLLDVLDVTNADFRLCPLPKCSRVVMTSAQNIVEPAIGVREFGSNLDAVTPSDASILRTPPGSLPENQGLSVVSQVPGDSMLVNPDEVKAEVARDPSQAAQDDLLAPQ